MASSNPFSFFSLLNVALLLLYYTSSIVSIYITKRIVLRNEQFTYLLLYVSLITNIGLDGIILVYMKWKSYSDSSIDNDSVGGSVSNSVSPKSIGVSNNNRNINININKLTISSVNSDSDPFRSVYDVIKPNYLILKSSCIGSILFILIKLYNYSSLLTISITLNIIIKSSTPLLSVFLLSCYNRTIPSFNLLISLVFISIGIVLSSLNQFNLYFQGIVYLLYSTLLSIIYTYLYKSILSKYSNFSILYIHYNTNIMTLLLSLPYIFYLEHYKVINIRMIYSSLDTSMIFMIIASVLCSFILSLLSILILHKLSVVSHQVINLIKRVLMIGISEILLPPLNETNFEFYQRSVGILLSLYGTYTYFKVSSAEHNIELKKEVEYIESQKIISPRQCQIDLDCDENESLPILEI